MKTLKSLMVVPQFDAENNIVNAKLTRYLDEGGYRQTLSADVTSFSAESREAFGAVVAYAQQVRSLDERMAQVFGEMAGQAPDRTHVQVDPETQQEVPVVDSYRPVVNLACTLRKLDGSGERTVALNTEQVSADFREAVLRFWELITNA